MLTIQNYYKLCEKKIPLTYWQVDYCTERENCYEIKIINKHNGLGRKVQLSRKSEYSQTGNWAYYFSEDGTKLHSCLTADYMKDMNSFLSGLATILQYG